MRKKKRIKSLILKWSVIIVGLFFSLPAIWGVIHNSIKIHSLKARKKELEAENKRLKLEISRSLSSEYIERVARVRLGLKRADELEYRFVSGEGSPKR